LESPRNGGINGYFTFEHGLLQGEPSIITSKWGLWHRNGGFITPDTHILYIAIILYTPALKLSRPTDYVILTALLTPNFVVETSVNLYY
jgi:hypothetical protein